MKNSFSMLALLWILVAAAGLVIILTALYITLKKTSWKEKEKKKIFIVSVVLISSWVILLSVLSINGFFSDFSKFPPRLIFAIVFPLPFVFAIAFSKKGIALLQLVPQHWLIFFQSFRVIVEILLWIAFLENLLPAQMTFEGGNFDVLTPILAVPVGYFLLQRKNYSARLAIAYNFLGLALLLNILVISMLSMPTPMRHFMAEPSAELVAQFPFIFLPGILVPIAYSMHIFSLRKLFHEKRSGSFNVSMG